MSALLLCNGLEELSHLAREGVEANHLPARFSTHSGLDRAQREQVRRQALQPLGLLERVEQPCAVRLGGALARKRDIEVSAERGDGRAQLVGRVRGEAPQVADRRLETGEQAVQHGGEPVHVAGATRRQPAVEGARLDRL